VGIEGGYHRDIDRICENIHALADLNIAGINIEDSVVNKQREILDPQVFADKISKVKKYLLRYKIDLFINARTDFYLMGLDNPLEETVKRVQIYEKSGADGLFVPGIVSEKDIKGIAESSHLPLNVMAMPQLPDFKQLSKLGVNRISMGPLFYNHLLETFEQTASELIQK